MIRPLLVCLTALVTLPSCDLVPSCDRVTGAQELVKSARFGTFFGGQVQEVRDLPFELDPARQTQGFRIEFSEPLYRDVEIEWKIQLPPRDARRKSRAADESSPTRLSMSGKELAHAGQSTFDRPITFRPGDPLGVWNVRVVVGGKVVIDRPVEVYDAQSRARASREDAGP